MATISRRKWRRKLSYVAQVRRKGFKTLVKSFSTKTDAKKWARAMENEVLMIFIKSMELILQFQIFI